MRPEEEIILILSRHRLSAEVRKQICALTAGDEADYDRLLRLATDNGVAPFIFRNLTGEDGMPSWVIDRLKVDYYQTLKRNLGQLGETLRIASLLSAAGIESIPLKGPLASERFFGDAGKYPSSDIDILVRPEDIGRARQVLEEAGYRNTETMDWGDLKRSTYHAAMSRGGYHVELHWNLAVRYFSVPPEFWWQKTSCTVCDGKEIILLSHERYLLYLIFRTFAKGYFPLKFLVLAAGLIESSRKDFSWSEFFGLAESYRMSRIAAFTLSFLRNELGADCPGQIVMHNTAYRFLRRLVLSGLFTSGRRVHLRMLLYALLLQSPGKSIPVLLRRIFPPLGEIRLRYGLPAGSKAVYLYYLLNPVLLATRRQETGSGMKDEKVQ